MESVVVYNCETYKNAGKIKSLITGHTGLWFWLCLVLKLYFAKYAGL